MVKSTSLRNLASKFHQAADHSVMGVYAWQKCSAEVGIGRVCSFVSI